MSPRARLMTLWVTALVAPLATIYALLSVVFYAWLNASGSWSAERASLWSGGAFVAFCVLAVVSVAAVVKLIRHYNRQPRLSD
ncbi:MAG: hypothetical protein AMXMBFR45_07820 [Gammaproteobacteria bacterium]|nr:MAG: hypothetical protein BroJett010_15120 [Gammaproteobacteria bacterium]